MSAASSDVGCDADISYAAKASPTMEQIDTLHEECFNVACASEAIGSSVQGIRSLLSRLKQAQTLVTVYAKFTNVSPEIAKLHLSKACHQLYSSSTRCLIVTVPGNPHEVLASNFPLALYDAVPLSNLPRMLCATGATRAEGTAGYKEPDWSWNPRSRHSNGDNRWPSIVLEVGVSESKQKLRADAAWWIANSEGLVKLVITVSIDRATPTITFESIILQQPVVSLRNGRLRHKPTVRQSLVISRLPGPNQPITSIPNTPLLITCEEYLSRPPTPPETDILIPISSLEEIASEVWSWQGF